MLASRQCTFLLALTGLTPALALAENPFSLHRAAPVAPAQSAGRAKLEAAATVPFRATVDGRTGALAAIQGGRLPLSGSLAEKARSFFVEHGESFGLDPRIELRAIARSTIEDRATLALYLGDIPIEGVLARARFDGDALVSAALRSPPSSATTGAFALGADAAASVASRAIEERRTVAGKTSASRTPLVTKVYVPLPDSLRAAYRVEIYAEGHGEAWLALVDASSGELLRVQDRVRHGTKGFLPVDFDGSFITFQKFTLGDAKGRVFPTQDAAIFGSSAKKTVKNFAVKGAPGANVSKGFIFGRASNVFDFFGDDPFEPGMTFDFDPFVTTPLASGIPEYDAFDCININYQLELFYQHLLKNLGKSQLASNLAMPVVVNSPETEINAFFAPEPWPDPVNPITFGYLEFFDLTTAAMDPAVDVARDPIACCHEYVHAWLFYEDLSFDDLLDFPPRAVGEALPDFFATTLHQDNEIGRYIGEVTGSGPLRVLQDDDRFPETTIEWLFDHDPGPGMILLPEEHGNGEIFGSFLLDVRDQLGAKKTESLVFDAAPTMPHTMADVGFTTNDVVANPVFATQEYFFNCATALLFEVGSAKDSGVIVGAGMGRGIFSGTDDFSVFLNLEQVPDRKLTIPTVFPRANGSTEVSFHLKQGRKLKITVQADSLGTLLPDFALKTSDGGVANITFTDPKITSLDGKTVSQANILMGLPLGANPQGGDPFYVLTVNALSGTGYYKITLDA